MSYRDTVRAQHATRDAQVRTLGINIEDVRKESRSNQGTASMTTRLMNEPTPTQGHERHGYDDFAGQAFDGTNQDYTLSHRVLGQNINVWLIVQASGSLIRLTKTTNPAPSTNQFFFDGLFTVRVNPAPQALDGLLAAYVRAL